MTTVETAFLRTLPRWQPDRNGISRTFHFDDFGAATRFVAGSPSTPPPPAAGRPSPSATTA